jgi:integrase
MLTTKQIASAAPGPKTRKLFDGRGLYLELSPDGARRWRLKYRFAGKEKRISLGVYPDVSLKVARERCEDARRLLLDGVDPSAERQATRVAAHGDSFETVAREWYAAQTRTWAASHAPRVLRRLERDVFPHVGRRSISEVTAPELLKILRSIETRGAVETAHRALQNCGQILRYAIATGRATRDPSADLRGALLPVVGSHLPALTEPKALGALLRAINGYEGQPTTGWALRLAPLVFVRPGELRQAEWAEINLNTATWTIPEAKLKASTQDHVVPLARQAVEILREAEGLTGRGRYVFPSIRTVKRPMSNMTLNAALRRLGYASAAVSVHGFRATARTMLDELLHFRPDWIEHQLAHRVKDPLGRAYNRTAFLVERRRMMQAWADYLDGLRAAAPR